MKPVQCILWFGLWMVGLHKAIAVGVSSSSKRKAGDSDSEDWASFSIRLHTSNVVPATTAKLAIEKAQKAGAAGIKSCQGKGQCCQSIEKCSPQNLMATHLLGQDSNEKQKDQSSGLDVARFPVAT